MTENDGLYARLSQDRCVVPTACSGYVQVIDFAALMHHATSNAICLQPRPGHCVVRGTPLMRVVPGKRIMPEVIATLNDTFVVGAERTLLQDGAVWL